MQYLLLSRDEFREQVFKRDKHKCVVCQAPAQDAHHIMERRLWPDGGYYLDNGASLCGRCHLLAESTSYETSFIREKAGIKDILLPPHLYRDQSYDKWGNVILEDSRRIPGELFYDDSVQKIMKQGSNFESFVKYAKYPRTYHLPWSPGVGKSDRVMENYPYDFDVIVTEKMDGENTTLYDDYIHARSINGKPHASRDYVKNLWASIRADIPRDMRICGENLWAKHSIPYSNLEDYFLVFSIWINDKCFGWDETTEWCNLLGLKTVPLLYSSDNFYGLINKRGEDLGIDPKKQEGYVVRPVSGFRVKDFSECVGKYVRANHVSEDTQHWFAKPIERNKKREEGTQAKVQH